jgi:pimeloyl-ACP methyl ester carboxylesterase
VIPSRARGIALAVVLVALLAGCSAFGSNGSSSAGASRSTGSSSPATPSVTPSAQPGTAQGLAGLAAYYRQKLSWKSCHTGKDQCATLRVPLDYAKPRGRSIGIALLKVPALDPGSRIGSMVVNPGGPGESGVDYAAGAASTYGKALREVYDTVGFDPRGVDRSAPVECASDKQLDTYVESDPDPTTPAEMKEADGLLRQLGEGCLRRSGAIARHVSTIEVAKDLDILRAAVGDTKLTYFGASYGTAIGATYADLFPTHVGRMVLDGALDPATSTVQLNLVQAHGFETALRSYVADCVRRGSCYLGSTVDQGTRRIKTFLDSVEAKPLSTSTGAKLTSGMAVYGVWYPLYDSSSWPVLDKELQDAFAGDGSLLLTVADAYLHRDAAGHYTDNSFEAFYAINCLDHDDGLPSSQVKRYLPQFEKASPTFGAIFAYSISACHTWPIHSGQRSKPVKAIGSPPIMVVGTTRDPATPLVWARALVKQLPHGVLVKRNGDGHTGYGRGNSCVNDTVESYLVKDTVPRGQVNC